MKYDMRKSLVQIILFMFGFLMYNQSGISQSGNEKIFRLKVDFSNTGKVKMSDLFSEIKYIPLETNPDCLIGYMHIAVFGKDIIIGSSTGAINGGQGLYRFSDEGKFLNKIGILGRGPGEYSDYCDVCLIGDTVFVLSTFTRNINCYTLNGVFLKNYHLNIDAPPKSIVQLNDKSYMISLSRPSSMGYLIKTDRNFNIKTGYIKKLPLNGTPLPSMFQKTKNQIFYYYNYIDTIFDISQGYPVPSIKVDFGEYKISRERRAVNEEDNVIANKPNILYFTTSDQYLNLVIMYPFKSSTYTISYRISDGIQSSWTELINDIDKGTLDRWPGFMSANNLVFNLMPTTILDRYKNMTNAEKSDPKNSGFVNMASKITPESNPVIMICKFK
jgi:hypothetical protein